MQTKELPDSIRFASLSFSHSLSLVLSLSRCPQRPRIYVRSQTRFSAVWCWLWMSFVCHSQPACRAIDVISLLHQQQIQQQYQHWFSKRRGFGWFVRLAMVKAEEGANLHVISCLTLVISFFLSIYLCAICDSHFSHPLLIMCMNSSIYPSVPSRPFIGD